MGFRLEFGEVTSNGNEGIYYGSKLYGYSRKNTDKFKGLEFLKNIEKIDDDFIESLTWIPSTDDILLDKSQLLEFIRLYLTDYSEENGKDSLDLDKEIDCVKKSNCNQFYINWG